METQHRFWWRVVTRYAADSRTANILRLCFVHPNGSLRLKNGCPQHRKPYRVLQRALRRYHDITVSTTRTQQLAHQALAEAAFSFYGVRVSERKSNPETLRKLVLVVDELRREKEKGYRSKKKPGEYDRRRPVNRWFQNWTEDSENCPTTNWPGQQHGTFIDWLARG